MSQISPSRKKYSFGLQGGLKRTFRSNMYYEEGRPNMSQKTCAENFYVVKSQKTHATHLVELRKGKALGSGS